jgi:hypothetical protein
LQEEHILRVCESRELRRRFGTNREDVIESWRIRHKEKHHTFLSTNIIRMIKSRRIRRPLSLSHIGDKKYIQNSVRNT